MSEETLFEQKVTVQDQRAGTATEVELVDADETAESSEESQLDMFDGIFDGDLDLSYSLRDSINIRLRRTQCNFTSQRITRRTTAAFIATLIILTVRRHRPLLTGQADVKTLEWNS